MADMVTPKECPECGRPLELVLRHHCPPRDVFAEAAAEASTACDDDEIVRDARGAVRAENTARKPWDGNTYDQSASQFDPEEPGRPSYWGPDGRFWG